MNAFQILGIEQKEDINYNVQLPGDEIDNENDPLIVQLPPIKDFQLSMVKIPIKPTTMPGPSASDSPSKDGDNKFENDDTGRLLQALMVRLKWSRLTFDISAAY